MKSLIEELEAFQAKAKDTYFDEATVKKCIAIVRQHESERQPERGSADNYPPIPEGVVYNPGYDELWNWFSLSHASFLTVPRILMHAMPDKWQWRMAKLLNEYDEFFPYQPNIGTRVQATSSDKLIKWPSWYLNYRRPDYAEIEKLRGNKIKADKP